MIGSGKSPLQYLMDVMMDKDVDDKRRDWAAEKAAAFIHPQPAPAQREIQIALPPINGADEIPAAIAAVMQAVGKGEIAPGEAQSLVSVIDAQRKAIETGDILKRLEALEEERQRGS